MEDQELQGQQKENQGKEQEGKENSALGKHPFDESAMDGQPGNNFQKPPELVLQAKGGDDFKVGITAVRLQKLTKDLWEGNKDDYSELVQLVESIPQEKLKELDNTYQMLYGKPALADIYRVCSRWPTAFNTSGRHVLYRIGKHMTVNPLSSEKEPGEKGHLKYRSHGDLLPAMDVVDSYNDGHGDRLRGVRADIDGMYAVEGKETEFVFDLDRVAGLSEKKFQGSYQRLAGICLVDDEGKSKFKRFSKNSGYGKRQTTTMTPWKSGTFKVQYWISHPSGRMEIMERTLLVKPVKDISAEALKNVAEMDYTGFNTELDNAAFKLGGGIHSDQHSIAKEKGDPYIVSEKENPIRPAEHEYHKKKHYTRLTAHGMGRKDNKIRWYVRFTYNGGGDDRDQFLKPQGPTVQPDHRPWTHCARNEVVYEVENNSSNWLSHSMFKGGQYAFIAEEVDKSGQPTGKTAIYRHAVLNDEQNKRLQRVEEHSAEAREYGARIVDGKQVQVRAAYTNTERAGSTVLSLFIGPSKADPKQLVLVDLTPGANRQEFHGKDLDACLAQFESQNTYPPGHISLQVAPNNQGIPAKAWDCERKNRLSKKQMLSSAAGWASIGLAGLGVIASAVPFAQPAAPFLFAGSAAMVATSGGLSLLDRFDDKEFNYLGAAIDVVSMATAFLNLGVIGKGMGRAAVAQPGGKFLIRVAIGSEIVEGVLLSADMLAQLNGILLMDVEPGERERMLVTWIANGLLLGTMTVLSAKEMREMGTGKLRDPNGDMQDRRDSPDQGQTDRHHPEPEPRPDSNLDGNRPESERLENHVTRLDEDIEVALNLKSESTKQIMRSLSPKEKGKLHSILVGRDRTLLGQRLNERYDRIIGFYIEKLEKGEMDLHGLTRRLDMLERFLELRRQLREHFGRRYGGKGIGLPNSNLMVAEFDVRFADDMVDLSGLDLVGEQYSISGINSNTIFKNMDAKDLGPLADKDLSGFPPSVFDHGQPVPVRNGVRPTEVSVGAFDFDPKHKNDAERKFFEDFYFRLEERIGKYLRKKGVFDRVTGGKSYYSIREHGIPDTMKGKITLYTEIAPCHSCTNIIKEQFPQYFLDQISIEVVDGVDYK